MDTARPTLYEQEALREIYAWRTRQDGLLGQVIATANRGLRDATDWAFQVPGLQWTVDNVVAGLVRVVNEVARETVWQESVLSAYRRQGYAVTGSDDIRALPLRVTDEMVERVDTKYRTVTGAQGLAAGLAGLAGVVPDVVGLVGFSLRAVAEYAAYYGFDIGQEEERCFALKILCGETVTVADPDQAEALSQRVADTRTKQTVENVAVSVSVRGLSRVLGQRLTASKLFHVVPVAGALISGGANAMYAGRVCTAALHLYRERRLLAHYAHETLAPYYR